MSIATEIERLSGVRTDIFTSLTNKGVEVPETATFSSCPALIDSIPAGGQVDGYINPDYKYGASISVSTPFTATQVEQYDYSDNFITSALTLSGWNKWYLIPFGELKRMGEGAEGSATIIVNSTYYTGENFYYSLDCLNMREPYGVRGKYSTSSNSGILVYPPSALLSAYNYIKDREGISDDSNIGIGSYGLYYGGGSSKGTVTMKEATGTHYPYPDRPMTIEGTYTENSENTLYVSSNLSTYIKLNQSANYPVNGSYTGSGSTYASTSRFTNYEVMSGIGEMALSAFEITPQPSIDEVAPNSAYSFTFGETTGTSSEMFGNLYNIPAE